MGEKHTDPAHGRLWSEIMGLAEKQYWLRSFLDTEAYKNLSIVQQDLLLVQLETMKAYEIVLRMRYKNW